MKVDDKRMEEIAARVAAATPGPWEWVTLNEDGCVNTERAKPWSVSVLVSRRNAGGPGVSRARPDRRP